MQHIRLRDALGAVISAAWHFVCATCGSTPTEPGPVVDFAVQSVSPGTGPATGGTELTIRGSGFATGATVTIGGRPATDVAVRGADMITAKTPASTIAGAVDIAVLVNGRSGTLAGGFRYEVARNTTPTIKSIVAQGKRVRQPANFGDYGETLTVTAVVEDAQSNPVATDLPVACLWRHVHGNRPAGRVEGAGIRGASNDVHDRVDCQRWARRGHELSSSTTAQFSHRSKRSRAGVPDRVRRLEPSGRRAHRP